MCSEGIGRRRLTQPSRKAGTVAFLTAILTTMLASAPTSADLKFLPEKLLYHSRLIVSYFWTAIALSKGTTQGSHAYLVRCLQD